MVTAAAAVAPSSPSRPGRVARNIVILSGGQAASWLLGILWFLVVPRRLGPSAIGEFVIAMATAGVLGIVVNQGATQLVTREVARDPSSASRLVGGAIVMKLAIALPACFGMLLYIHIAGFGSDRAVLIWLATTSVIATSVTTVFGAAFTGLERMEYLAFGGLVANSLLNVLGVGLVLAGGRVLALMELAVALSVCAVALNVYWARRLYGIALRGAWRVALHVLRAGVSFWIGGLFFAVYLWIDLVLLSLLVPARVVGWYGVPTELFGALLVVASIVCTAWFPRIASAHAISEAVMRDTARPAVEVIIVLSLPIACGTALVARPLVALVYGPAFSGAVPVLTILGACTVPTFFNMMADQILAAQGRQASWVKVIAVATVLNIAANLVLIPRFQAAGNGAAGAAVALLATEIFESIAAIWLLRWLAAGPLLARLGRAAAATALMGAAVVAVSRFGVGCQVVVGVVAFVGFALILRVPTPQELTAVRGLGSRAYARIRPAAVV